MEKRAEERFENIQKSIDMLNENFVSDKDYKNFVIYKGQKLEADIAYIEIYQQAKKSIYVVDDYMNAKSLQHLSQKADGVAVTLFTENGKGGRGFLTNSLVTDFQIEYPTLWIFRNNRSTLPLIVYFNLRMTCQFSFHASQKTLG